MPPFKNLKQAQTFGKSLTTDDSPYRKDRSPAELTRLANQAYKKSYEKVFNILLKDERDILTSKDPKDIERLKAIERAARAQARRSLTSDQRSRLTDS